MMPPHLHAERDLLDRRRNKLDYMLTSAERRMIRARFMGDMGGWKHWTSRFKVIG